MKIVQESLNKDFILYNKFFYVIKNYNLSLERKDLALFCTFEFKLKKSLKMI